MDRKQNAWIILFRAFRNFFSIAFENLFALLSRNPPRAHSYNTLNQTLKDGPKSFYENPTGIKLGRAPMSMIAHFFYDKSDSDPQVKK